MVAMYTIAGRQVGSHILAMATLGTLFGGTYLSMGGSDKKAQQTPPINASNKDEEKFIKEFLQQVNADDIKEGAKAKH